MRHLILCSVMWLCGLMMAVGQNVPQVIPALQQWKSAKGKLVLPETGKVIVSSDEENEPERRGRNPGAGPEGNVWLGVQRRSRKERKRNCLSDFE